MTRWTGFLLAGALLLCGSPRLPAARAADEPAKDNKEGIEFFEKNIRPVLAESCYKCHRSEAKANKKLKGKLYLDSLGGDDQGRRERASRPSSPGDPDKSRLIKADPLHGQGDGRRRPAPMPPKPKDGKSEQAAGRRRSRSSRSG